MSIPQITQLPPAPQRSDASADFVAKADAHVASLSQFVTQTNQVVADINQISPQVADDAALASASAASAAGIANYKGLWSSLSGALNVPASVKHNGSFYFLLNNLANVALSEPSVTDDWQLIVNVGNIRKSLLDSPLCRLFLPNKVVDTLAGPLTWTRASTATYIDRYGVVRTAAVDEPREEAEGWLIEGQSTNLLTYSEQFDNAVWSKRDGVAITPNTSFAPDGTMTADNINVTAGAIARIDQFIVLSPGQYTFSLWVEAAAGRTFGISINTTTSIAQGIFTTTGKWQRVTATITTTSSDFALFVVIGDNGTTLSDYNIWGAQLEQLPFASSYIPTTTAPATRVRDDVTFSGEGNVPRPSGTYSLAFCQQSLLGDAPMRTYGVGDYEFWYGRITGGVFTNVAGSSLGIPYENGKGIIISSDGDRIRMYSGANSAQQSNLEPPSSNSSPDIPSIFRIGNSQHSVSAFEAFYGHLRDFRIYDFALNADEAQFLAGVK